MMGPEIPLTPVPFVRFDEKGDIFESGQMSTYAIERMRQAGERVMVGSGKLGTHYVCLKRMRPRLKAANPTRLEGLTLRSVPVGSLVKIEDVQPGVPDRSAHEASGTVELEFELPGTYRVEVASVKHLTAVFEVTV